jgi:hypothetical protein
VRELLELHYDPLYQRSITRNFPRHADGVVAAVDAIDQDAFRALARRVIDAAAARTPPITQREPA